MEAVVLLLTASDSAAKNQARWVRLETGTGETPLDRKCTVVRKVPGCKEQGGRVLYCSNALSLYVAVELAFNAYSSATFVGGIERCVTSRRAWFFLNVPIHGYNAWYRPQYSIVAR